MVSGRGRWFSWQQSAYSRVRSQQLQQRRPQCRAEVRREPADQKPRSTFAHPSGIGCGRRPRPGPGAASGSPVTGRGGVYPRRSDRPGACPAGRRRVGGRPAVAVGQGVDLAAGRRQRTTHPRPLPAAAGPGPCPEYGIGSAGPGPWAGCQFSARCLSHHDPRACGCWIDKKLSTRRCRNRGSWVVVAWVAYPSLTVAYQTRSATWIRISLMRETRRYNSRLPMTSRRSWTSSSADAAWR